VRPAQEAFADLQLALLATAAAADPVPHAACLDYPATELHPINGLFPFLVVGSNGLFPFLVVGYSTDS
jgi:hypothetical protein